MTIIHMETEETRYAANLLDQKVDALLDLETALKRAAGRMNSAWQGGRRSNAFQKDFQSLIKAYHGKVMEMEMLALRLRREVDEWVEVDSSPRIVGAAASLSLIIPESILEQIKRWLAEQERYERRREAREKFQKEWKGWSEEERRKYLQKLNDEFCKKFTLNTIDVKFEDLPDKYVNIWKYKLVVSDYKGVYRGPDLVIDVDNLNNPDTVITTFYHESRHHLQWFFAANPDKIPEGLTKEQVESWTDNIKNYKKPDDDYEAYRAQPVESDAREFANKYVDEFLDAY